MTPFEQAKTVAQRFQYGEQHHWQLANFFGTLGIQLWEQSEFKNAFGDAKKRMEMDNFIVDNYKKYPNYPILNVDSVNAEFKNSSPEAIKTNEKKWLKNGFDEKIKYEKETLQLFENLLKQPVEPKDEKLTQKIKQYAEDVKKELQKIESVNTQLQQADYDFDKFVKEYKKGDTNMPRYEDRRRMEDERNRLDMELRRMDEDDRNYPNQVPTMGFMPRVYPYYNPTPYFEHTQPMYPNQNPNQPYHAPMQNPYESEEQRRNREYQEMEMRRHGSDGRYIR